MPHNQQNQYQKLTDSPSVNSGKYEIWYDKDPMFRVIKEKWAGQQISKDQIEKSHICLGKIHLTNVPEEAFGKLQGCIWSPEGEAQNLILQLGLHHTSMSVGDLVIDSETRRGWICASSGWYQFSLI